MVDDDRPQPGTGFRTAHAGRSGTVRGVLGEGGQGIVYATECEGVELALKWYHEHVATLDRELLARLTRAVDRGPPAPDFLWPIDIVTIPGRPSFGYLMELRTPRFHGMKELVAPPPRRLDLPLATRLIVCLRTTACFLRLHAAGFCYQDINFGNLFFDPATGDVRICDNDNVDVDGAGGSVWGTRKFMAPEVVRRECLPCTATDLFSLAVLFFYVLTGWHPLDGRIEAETRVLDAATERRLYGDAPRFLFDPVDTSNGPVPGFHDGVAVRWALLGARLRDLFVRGFGPGLADPARRIHEPEWLRVLSASVTAVQACPSCGAESVFEPDRDPTCPVCRRPRPVPPHLSIDRRTVVLGRDGGIPAPALDEIDPPDFRALAGRVEAHPTRPGVFGIRNLGSRPWVATLPDRRRVEVAPSRTIVAADGLEIDFGGRRGRLHWPDPPFPNPRSEPSR